MTDSKKPHFGQAFQFGAAPAVQGQPRFSFRAGYATAPRMDGVPVPLPDDAQACNTQGNDFLLAHRTEDAIRAYDRAIALSPGYVDPHFNRGNALLRLQRHGEALASFERAITLSPRLVLAHYNRAAVLQGMNRMQEAAEGYRAVLELEPHHAQARFNAGCILLAQKQFEEAVECMDLVIAHAPQMPEAHNNKGSALLKLGRLRDAITCFSQALALRPQYAEAYTNRGNARIQLGHYPEALEDLGRALQLQPHGAESRHLLGKLLSLTNRHEEAVQQLQWAHRQSPGLPALYGDLMGAKTACCSWQGIDHDVQQALQAIAEHGQAVEPFTLLGLADAPLRHKEAARTLVQEMFPASSALGACLPREPGGKIRVGYFSADFRNHAVAYLIAELFEVHDRGRFEWFAFSVGPDAQDEMRQRVAAAFDHFIDVRERSDIDIARLSRELGIDIAVDLTGFTRHNRFGCFSFRCAPVQVSYLGYPGTTGADYMDYVIADRVVIPPPAQAHFTEKVVYLPHSYQVNDSRRKVSGRAFTRGEAGLPPDGFVFCCFNNNYKIMPSTFDGWMRILLAVEGSVLWLLEDNPAAARNLRREAQARGISAERLVFAPRMPMDEHLARHRLADLFLDTLPYNAHTTASDALWAGLPLLTCMGESFASRVAASLLYAVGLPELVTHTQAEFEARAIDLARDRGPLRGMRDRLREQAQRSPLFDARRFARHIEAAYATMYERSCRGLPPDVIEVE
ncbi:MAG: tetratricopeptide repeat protein [Acidovorax sp.]|nr:tetratricopeptide repeat protein [Acidovorax sp.]